MPLGRTNIYVNSAKSEKFFEALEYCKITRQSASRIMTDALIKWYEETKEAEINDRK